MNLCLAAGTFSLHCVLQESGDRQCFPAVITAPDCNFPATGAIRDHFHTQRCKQESRRASAVAQCNHPVHSKGILCHFKEVQGE